MSLKSLFCSMYAKHIYKCIEKDSQNSLRDQEKILKDLLKKAENTYFGQKYNFKQIKNYKDFKNSVPIYDYEKFKYYLEKINSGEQNVVWPKRPLYFAKTSGTVSGQKNIPISQESIHNHINTARNALFNYIHTEAQSKIINGKMIFLSGSPELVEKNNIKIGRLSGIVNHHVPQYLKRNQVPSWQTNCLEDWEEKVQAIVEETLNEDLRVISGIPPWLIMYFEKLQNKAAGKSIGEIFPNLTLIIHGGVNYEPYSSKITKLLGREIDQLELFPASEGFFAFQNNLKDKGLLLNTNSGIYYEFIPLEESLNSQAKRINLAEVELNKSYALLVSNNAGLWCYDIGDVVKFTSINPYKIRVVGRTKHFISAFGEHVIAEEIDTVITNTVNKFALQINEFTVAPFINSTAENCHEWLIEFETMPTHLNTITQFMDELLQQKNIYYKDLRKGNVLTQLKIIPIKKNGFNNFMKTLGKLGGQNKIPHVSNERNWADPLKNNYLYE